MTRQEFVSRALIVALIAIVAVSLLLLFGQIYPTILLAFVCWVLATALNMVVDQLISNGMSRPLAIGVTVTGLLIVLVLFAILVVPSLVREIGNLVNELPETAQSALDNYSALRDNNPLIEQILPQVDPSGLEETINQFTQNENGNGTFGALDIAGMVGSATSTLLAIGSTIGEAVVQLLLILLITLFLMINPVLFERLIIAVVPKNAEARTLEILNEVRFTVREWVGAMVISVTVTGVLYWIVLGLILGLPNAVALSVIGGLATIVPTLGPTLAIIPVIVLALVEGPTQLLFAVILYSLVGVIQDRVINPIVMKNELDIPAAGLVLFQLIAASLLGFIGVLIAVPLLAVLMTLVREILVKDILEKRDGPPAVADEQGKLVFSSPEKVPKASSSVELSQQKGEAT